MKFTEEKRDDLKQHIIFEEANKNRMHIISDIGIHSLCLAELKKRKMEFIITRLASFCKDKRGKDYLIQFDVSENTVSLIFKDFISGEDTTGNIISFTRGNWAKDNPEMIPKFNLWVLWLNKNGNQFPMLITPLKRLDDKQ